MANKCWKKTKERMVLPVEPSKREKAIPIRLIGRATTFESKNSILHVSPNFDSNYQQVYLVHEVGGKFIHKSFKTEDKALVFANKYMAKNC